MPTAELAVYWNSRMRGLQGIRARVQEFFGWQTMRLAQGHARYGAPRKDQLYMKRLKAEVAAYERTGNQEHLINAANYCILETICPQNPKFHYNQSVDSVTRGVVV